MLCDSKRQMRTPINADYFENIAIFIVKDAVVLFNAFDATLNNTYFLNFT